MATVIRPEISQKNKYWISKHRHYELKHFCLQYPNWKQAYSNVTNLKASSISEERPSVGDGHSDLTSKCAIIKIGYAEKIDIIEKAARDADKQLCHYILKAVTEELSYNYLRSILKIPCSKDTYYDRYRRFFWLLDQARN